LLIRLNKPVFFNPVPRTSVCSIFVILGPLHFENTVRYREYLVPKSRSNRKKGKLHKEEFCNLY
jgi:hypothetical protein